MTAGSDDPGPSPRPLVARCRTCAGEFEIADLAETRDGACPVCGAELSPGWTILLVEEAEKLQTVHDALLRCLRRLAGLPGNLQMTPAPFWQNLLEQVPWEDQLATQPRRIAAEIERARGSLEASRTEPAVEQLRRLADQMRTLALLLDIHQDLTGAGGSPAGDAARASASELERGAAELGSGQRTAEQLEGSLDRAASTAEGAARESQQR